MEKVIYFKDWLTEDKYYDFIHKSRKADPKKYSTKLSFTMEEVLSISELSIPRETVLTDKNGKERIVYTLPKVQSLYCSLYCEYLMTVRASDIHNKVVSYKKGMSVGKACRAVSNRVEGNLFVKMDVTKYFDSVSREYIQFLIKEYNLPEHLANLYTQDLVVTRDGSTEPRYLGLIQGNPLSSFFANSLLYEFDVFMDDYHGVYYRYSDDMLFSVKKDKDSEIERASEYLSTYGLSINPKKTDVYKDQVEFLGLIIEQGKVTASEKYMVEFRKTVKLTTLEKKEKCIDKYIRRVIKSLAGSWLSTAMYGCRLEYLFGALSTGEQFYELDNLIYANIQYLLTGSRNSNVACKKGWTFKYIKNKFDFSLEKAYYLYKESEILSRTYLSYILRPTESNEVDFPLTKIISLGGATFNYKSESVSVQMQDRVVSIPWSRVYDDSGLLSDYEVLEPYITDLTVKNPLSLRFSLQKISNLARHERFKLDLDFKLFLVKVALQSSKPIDNFKTIRSTEGKILAAMYSPQLNTN